MSVVVVAVGMEMVLLVINPIHFGSSRGRILIGRTQWMVLLLWVRVAMLLLLYNGTRTVLLLLSRKVLLAARHERRRDSCRVAIVVAVAAVVESTLRRSHLGTIRHH